MKRIIWLLAFLTLAPAYAADNVAVTPGSGKTIACLDISTVCFAKYIPYDITGAAFGVTGNPFFVTSTTLATAVNQATVTTWAGGTLGAMANYGTSPGAVLVPGANVFVTGSTGLAIGSTTSGQTLSLIGCASTTAIPTATTAATWPVSCDPGNSIRVVNGASTYNTIAASQSAQALTGGSGGATGDYLSHCTVIPTSTSPGVVTILDNSTAIYSFPGGASSLSNLVPFTIPIGAQSTTGAWKVTTGASLSVVCVGRFH